MRGAAPRLPFRGGAACCIVRLSTCESAMKKNGLIHAGLLSRLAQLRHTDLFVVADAGLPVPRGVPVIDLAVVYGLPRFADILVPLLRETVVEAGWVAIEIDERNPDCARLLDAAVADLTRIPHAALKTMVGQASFVVRTGEDTPYANVILRAGVPFGQPDPDLDG